ncbi:sugar 3,4-ketoisomerase [Pontibacter mangrovi]|uniref:WxcM-like domain-containing protein n=1 Tax=Pontibacter mangrovi TaxID=2589816 RepID=A0A501WCR4_9BACT|nr:FdtA/QdtA family cupin domain-containing protein [Pontibacter mangrovi]TPE45011.1 WxcM-like domain-containing protein [Pontibacter mangrovi]
MPSQPYLLSFLHVGDPGIGYITSTQQAQHIPFEIKRVFWTQGTPPDVVRGRHAHKATEQVLVALNGSITVEVDNGKEDPHKFLLTQPDQGLYLPPMVWANLHFSEGAILLSLTSSDFDEADYIRSYQAFVKLANS